MEAPHIAPSAIVMEEVESVWSDNGSLGLLGNYTNNSLYDEMDRCYGNNPFFNCTLEEYLLYSLGPKQLALYIAIPITIVYVLIFVTGLVGNVSVCIVIVRHPAMRTATNYYLFSLAVSDLTLLLLGLPNDISIYWHQYPYSLGIVFCKMRALLSEASSYVSVLTIVAFSMERYLAICHPLHLYTMSGLQRPVRIIAALWVISLICAFPICQHTTIHYLYYPPDSNNEIPDSAFCAILSLPYELPVWEISFLVFFILPGAIILLLYCRMGLRIRERSRNQLGKGVNGSVHGESRQTQSRKAIIRMLAAVVVAFFVCWAPFHAQRILYIYGRNWSHFKEINEWLFSVAGWLYYVSCTVNPILYNVMSNRYRVAFRETLCCGRKLSYRDIGLSRDQSSFREATIAGNGETSHIVRVRSLNAKSHHRTNAESRLARRTTLTTTISKDFAINRNSLTKTRWSDRSQYSKKWSSDDSPVYTPNSNKKPLKSGIKGLFSNLKNTDDAHIDSPASKRNHIMFEIETNNLLQSNNDNHEMDHIKEQPDCKRPQNDVISSHYKNREQDLKEHDPTTEQNKFECGLKKDHCDTRNPDKFEVTAIVNDAPRIGFENDRRSYKLAVKVKTKNEGGSEEDSSGSRSLIGAKDVIETCI